MLICLAKANAKFCGCHVSENEAAEPVRFIQRLLDSESNNRLVYNSEVNVNTR